MIKTRFKKLKAITGEKKFMFKKFFKKFRKSEDKGSALISVLGATAVIAIIAGAVTASSALNSNVIAAKLDSQQAINYAEAGIVDAVHKISTGFCTNRVEVSTSDHKDPTYDVNVYRATTDTLPAEDSNDWKFGCPSTTFASPDRWIRVESIGKWLKDGNINDATYEIQNAFFRIDPVDSSMIPQALTGSPANLRSGFSINQAPGVTGSNPTIGTTGLPTCPGNTNVLNANIVVTHTSSSYSNPTTCNINGSLSVTFTPTAGQITLNANSTTISGDICTNRKIGTSGLQNVKGSRFQDRLNCTKVSEYGYVPLLNKPIILQSNLCTNPASFKSTLSYLPANDRSILDLRNCTVAQQNAMLSSGTVLINSNTTLIVSHVLNMVNLNVSSTSNDGVLNIVAPSSTSSPNTAHCTTVSNTMILNNIKYEKGVKGMIYTSCKMSLLTGTNITGQLYAGQELGTTGNVSLTYAPSSLPYFRQKIENSSGVTTLVRIK